MSSAIQRMFAAVATVAIILTGTAVAQAPGQGRWTKCAPFPEPSQEIGGTSVNGKLYVIGGLPFAAGQSPAPKGIVWEYDGATDKWAKRKNMPAPAHHVAVTSYRGKLYVFGGGTQVEPGGSNWVPTNRAWEYDPAADSWRELAPMPTARGAAVAGEGGGGAEVEPVGSTGVRTSRGGGYDPAADSWRELAPMPTARGAAVAVEVGGKMYVVGGASVHPGQKIVGLSATVPHRALGTNEEYDPATNTWRTRSPMPTARNHAAIGAVNNKIYVLGGRVGAGFIGVASNTDVVEEYDPATDQWGAIRARMPTARSAVAWGVHGGRGSVGREG